MFITIIVQAYVFYLLHFSKQREVILSLFVKHIAKFNSQTRIMTSIRTLPLMYDDCTLHLILDVRLLKKTPNEEILSPGRHDNKFDQLILRTDNTF